MTREEAISVFKGMKRALKERDFRSEHEALNMAIESLQNDAAKRVDCSNFLLWLLEEIMDEENWELNAVADGEIIARKLKKLGLLEVKDGYYHRIFDENVWVVRCKDCRFWKNEHLCLVMSRYGSIDTKAEHYCSWGERREP